MTNLLVDELCSMDHHTTQNIRAMDVSVTVTRINSEALMLQ